MEHLPGGHEPRRLGQEPLSQLRVAGRRPHSPSRPTSSAAAAQERRGGQREARVGRMDRWQPQLYLLEAGACLVSGYIHSDSKLPECCNLYHVMLVDHLCFCVDPLSSWESEGIGSARPGIAQLFALSQSEVRSVHPLATALVAHCRLISILPADLTIKL